MNKIVMMLGILSVVLGCRTIGVGEPVIDAPVIVADGYTLERAVLAAAVRRRWTPAKLSDDVYRLTIRQRSNICCVDVVMKKGERISQGIFMKFFTTCDDDASGVRSGGLGSTKK